MYAHTSLCTLILSLLLASCTTTEHVPRSHMSTRAFKFNYEVWQSAGSSVTLNDEIESRATSYLTIESDSVYWIEPVSLSPISMPLDSIQSFMYRDRENGMLHGVLIGTLTGIGAGVVVTQLIESEAEVVYIPLLGMGGYLVGMITGAIIGAPHHTTITPPPLGR